jgi:hypothetical protein
MSLVDRGSYYPVADAFPLDRELEATYSSAHGQRVELQRYSR